MRLPPAIPATHPAARFLKQYAVLLFGRYHARGATKLVHAQTQPKKELN